MFANKYSINISTISTATTATTINIPIDMEYQLVDQGELVERVFVDTEVIKSINPIFDYEKIRISPTGSTITTPQINNVIYNVYFLPPDSITGSANKNKYSDIGFTDDDINFEKNNFTHTFLNLSFYDSDNALDQRLISFITIFSNLTPNDLTSSGKPLPAQEIVTNFILSNPISNPRGFSEGYYLYDYKDTIPMGGFKYLYMRATFNNAKTGKSNNLMVKDSPDTIDNLVHKLYTRYILYRNSKGFFYEIDPTYNGDNTVGVNNVTLSGNDVIVNLYQIQVL